MVDMSTTAHRGQARHDRFILVDQVQHGEHGQSNISYFRRRPYAIRILFFAITRHEYDDFANEKSLDDDPDRRDSFY
jgi:hypothetical protein